MITFILGAMVGSMVTVALMCCFIVGNRADNNTIKVNKNNTL